MYAADGIPLVPTHLGVNGIRRKAAPHRKSMMTFSNSLSIRLATFLTFTACASLGFATDATFDHIEEAKSILEEAAGDTAEDYSPEQEPEGTFVDQEVPAGNINGTNTIFTLASIPNPPSSLEFYWNGLAQKMGIDYTLSGSTITMINGNIPGPGDSLVATYRTGAIFPTHNLLGSKHADTTSANVSRGDLISGQGTPPKWGRLPVGLAERCLVSNGTEPSWGPCLFTGLNSGTVPFVSGSGLLSQDSLFRFDSSNRRLGLGTTTPTANLTIQALSSQGSVNLTQWLNSSGGELGRVESDGSMAVQRLTTFTNASRAAWRDGGSNVDPSAKQNGDFWFNSSQQSRKSYEAGQTHPLPQVLCSSTGGTTSSTTSTSLGSCFVPSFFFDAGDRIEITVNASHSGSASGFTLELRYGSNSVLSKSFTSSASSAALTASGGFFGSGVSWIISNTNNSATSELITQETTLTPTNSASISFRANLNSSSSDSITIRNFSVVRYPAQSNP